MAQTRTYSDLIATIQAKFGAHSGFTSTELTSIKHMVNSRIQDIYLESDYWENILVIGEERVVNDAADAVVPYTGAAVDAGGTNPYSGKVDTFMRIHKVKPWSDKSAGEYEFAGIGEGARLIGYNAAYGATNTLVNGTDVVAAAGGGTISISLNANTLDLYVGGTVQLSNFATSPGDINGIQTVTAVYEGTYLGGDATSFDIEVASITSGSWTLTGVETVEAPVAFCTYKKRIIDTVYGDGAGETTAIPLEWFECAACGVVADLHSGDGNEGSANKWEQKFQYALDLRVERLDAQHGPQSVGQSIFTHLSEQGRSTSY